MRGIRIADNLAQPLDQRPQQRPGDGLSLAHGPVHQPGTTMRRPAARVIVRFPLGLTHLFRNARSTWVRRAGACGRVGFPEKD